MPIRKIEEGYFFNHKQDEEFLSGCFVSLVKKLADSSDVRKSASASLISAYVKEDPNDDVLERTKTLLFALRDFKKSDIQFLDTPLWCAIVKEVKKMFLFSLPHYTKERYRDGIDLFFKHLTDYGIVRVEKMKSELI